MAQPATLARLARHEPRREDASHDGFQLAPEPADAERRAQITTRVEHVLEMLLVVARVGGEHSRAVSQRLRNDGRQR